jgi:hypothetical protein
MGQYFFNMAQKSESEGRPVYSTFQSSQVNYSGYPNMNWGQEPQPGYGMYPRVPQMPIPSPNPQQFHWGCSNPYQSNGYPQRAQNMNFSHYQMSRPVPGPYYYGRPVQQPSYQISGQTLISGNNYPYFGPESTH